MTPQEREEFVRDVAQAVRASVVVPAFSDEEVAALRLLVKKQEQSIALRQAIIEKSLTSLIWSGIVALGYMFVQWATAHGYKP